MRRGESEPVRKAGYFADRPCIFPPEGCENTFFFVIIHRAGIAGQVFYKLQHKRFKDCSGVRGNVCSYKYRAADLKEKNRRLKPALEADA